MSGGGAVAADAGMATNEENLLDDSLRPSLDDHLFGNAGNDVKNEESSSDGNSASEKGANDGDDNSDISDEESEKGEGEKGLEGSAISDNEDEGGNNDVSDTENKDAAAAKRRKIDLRDDLKRSNDDDEPKQRSKVVEKKEVKTASSNLTLQKKKKGKSYDYATKLNYLFRDARFFIVKSNNAENVVIAKSKNVWSTPPQNEARLNKAFDEVRNVLLIFSVKESGKFAGLARLATPSVRTSNPPPWILPPGLSVRALGGVFTIDWICKKVCLMSPEDVLNIF